MQNTASEYKRGYIKGILYTIGVVILLVGGLIWYVNNNYSYVYDANFKKSCMAQGSTESACGCALDIVKKNYSFQTAKAFETSGQLPESLITEVQYSCR